MTAETGWISIKQGEVYHTLRLNQNGWLAADMVQYVDEILAAEDQKIAILKLLGYTMELGSSSPTRRRIDHWVEIDIDRRIVTTNSELLRKAVGRIPVDPKEPYSSVALRRIYAVLDRYDFTVQFRK